MLLLRETFQFQIVLHLLNYTITIESFKETVLNGKILRVAAYQIAPFLMVGSDKKSLTGTKVNFLNTAVRQYNFSLKWDVSTDGSKGPGTIGKDGRPTDCMADIYYKRADLTLATAMTFPKSQFMEFTTSFDENKLVFVTPLPQAVLSWGSIFSSYDSVLWVLIFVTVVAFAVSFYVLLRVHFYYDGSSYDPYGRGHRTLVAAILIPYSVILDQHIGKIPKRLIPLTILLCIFVIFVGCGYKCNLVSFLSTPESAQIPHTYGQLDERDDYKVYLYYIGGVAFKVFRNPNEKVLERIGKRLNLITNTVVCTLNALREPKSVCIGWASPIMMSIMTNLTLQSSYTPLFQSHDSAYSILISFGLQKRSPYTKHFNELISICKDAGLTTKWDTDIVSSYRLKGIQWREL